MSIRDNESGEQNSHIDEQSALRSMQERDGEFFASTEENPKISVEFCPKSGIMRIESETIEGDADRIDLDLAAEFWRMTRRDARKNPPAEFTYVLAGSINPHFIAMLTYGRWLTQGGTVVNRLHVHHWWPLPAWVGAIKEEEK